MTISLVAALGTNRVIGRDGGLPWRLPSDLHRFKQLTMGKPIVMGRKTYQSIGRPLPGRRSVVLSRQPGYAPAGVEVVGSFEEALALLADAPEVMIIGGESVYAEALPCADRLYLSCVDAAPEGDAFFPDFDRAAWVVAAREVVPPDDQHAVGYTFFELRRA